MDFQKSSSDTNTETNEQQNTGVFKPTSANFKPKKSKKSLVLACLLVLSIAANAGLGYYAYQQTQDKPAPVASPAAEQPEVEPKEEESVDNIPEGYTLQENDELGVSFLWPDAWGDAPEVSSGPVESFVVKQMYDNDVKYNSEGDYWMYAETATNPDRQVGDYADISSQRVLWKDAEKTIYTFGFGDAGCGMTTPTTIHKGNVIQFSMVTVCAGESNGIEEGQIQISGQETTLPEEEFETQKDTVIESIKLY